jgi:NAD(P)-dependent dehydrogenase (short-subunit alcohol dehydrogenase family)
MVGTGGGEKGGRLEYISADVRDQKAMWKIGEEIGNREGRMDVCVAAAGILKAHTDCLEYPGKEFEEVRLFSSSLRLSQMMEAFVG